MPGDLLGQTSHTRIVLGDIQMRKHNGFTLIELVVVVMILGILAAVAAPKLLGTSSTASDNGIKETLGVVRDAIERYTAEHAGSLPPSTDGEAFKTALAPYLRVFPKSPLATGTDANAVGINSTAGSVAVTGTTAWMYNSKDGTFYANSALQVKSQTDPAVTYNTL
jgi:general secretion pathway protein G